MTAVGNAHRSAHTKAAFGEVQAVAHGDTKPVVGRPLDVLGIEPAGENEIFHQAANLVIGQRCHDRAAQPKRAPQPARHVVFAATFPGPERTRGANAALARVEAQHDLTERNDVVAAVLGGTNVEVCHRLLSNLGRRQARVASMSRTSWTASVTSSVMAAVSRS